RGLSTLPARSCRSVGTRSGWNTGHSPTPSSTTRGSNRSAPRRGPPMSGPPPRSSRPRADPRPTYLEPDSQTTDPHSEPGQDTSMSTTAVHHAYNDVVATHYDLDPQGVIGRSLDRGLAQLRDEGLLDGRELRVLDVGMGTGLFLEKLQSASAGRI